MQSGVSIGQFYNWADVIEIMGYFFVIKRQFEYRGNLNYGYKQFNVVGFLYQLGIYFFVYDDRVF